MQTAIQATTHRPAAKLQIYLLFGMICPLFLVAEAIPRFFMLLVPHEAKSGSAHRSTFVSAKENTYIAISYALMARWELQKFARHARTERLS